MLTQKNAQHPQAFSSRLTSRGRLSVRQYRFRSSHSLLCRQPPKELTWPNMNLYVMLTPTISNHISWCPPSIYGSVRRMTKDDIEADWPLVLCHRERVLARLAVAARRVRPVHRFDSTVGRSSTRSPPLSSLMACARQLGVSKGAIHDTLRRLVRFARRIEHQGQVWSRVDGDLVVIVPVPLEADAKGVLRFAQRLGYPATVEAFRH
jgi:hypothetical protein